MATTVASMLVTALADHGVTTVWGVVGDALNPITDAIRTEDRIEWIGVRHEEAGAFAASAQAQLTGTLGVCMGTVGPGSIHLLNGLYDAKKSHAPVLAVSGQVPIAEMGSNFFQEVDNDALFRDVAEFSRTVTSAEQLPYLLEMAVNTANQKSGVAVLTLPGDIGGLEILDDIGAPRFVVHHPTSAPASDILGQAAELIADADNVTMLVGIGAHDARDEILAIAETLASPIVLTLKAKEALEHDNPYQVGQSGLIGNPAAKAALDSCDLLLMVGTDFPYREWYPKGETVIQIDSDGAHIGRRTHVDLGLIGHARPTLTALQALLTARTDHRHLEQAREHYQTWTSRQNHLTDPGYDRSKLSRVRRLLDNREHAIRPEQLAASIDRHAADDAVFTTDTGMSTVWLSRFVTMSGARGSWARSTSVRWPTRCPRLSAPPPSIGADSGRVLR